MCAPPDSEIDSPPALGLHGTGPTVFNHDRHIAAGIGFADVPFGRACIHLLRDVRDQRGLVVYAYCLMPDHVHLLAAMTSRESLMGAIRAWKSLCYQERHKRGSRARFWQRSFCDHAIRDSEGIFDVAMYVLMNPVRPGLVRDFHEYPLCGSFEFTNL